ncbi:MAG TPA: molybdenum cofactor guanylyltransferase [Verrucomicrobiae bacterium]|nr:molybdenum cofactor guanylyltransferase [Verrucomicrobiae bacterium]
MNFSAVILAGGKSSRMGRDKAFLKIGGQTLLARQIQLARELGAAEIFISGRAETNYSEFNCRVLQDKFPDAGPLAGIERALTECSSPLVLVLAVDMPNMNADLLRRLASCCAGSVGAIPRIGDIEPLAAIYPVAARSLAATFLDENSNTVKTFAERCVEAGLASFVDLAPRDAEFFANWNSLADSKRCTI